MRHQRPERPSMADGRQAALRDRSPMRLTSAIPSLGHCIVRSAELLVRRAVSQPATHVGQVLSFADGSAGRVYRETVLRGAACDKPAVLIVGFRLRWVHGWGDRLFRAESILNTPLFVGFPGFVSKLWVAHDGNGVYRGVYQWNDPGLADAYVRALWWVLALVSERRSIRYMVIPDIRRDEMLLDPDLVHPTERADTRAWWRLTHCFLAPTERCAESRARMTQNAAS